MDSLVSLEMIVSFFVLLTFFNVLEGETYCTRLSMIALGTMSIIVLLTIL